MDHIRNWKSRVFPAVLICLTLMALVYPVFGQSGRKTPPTPTPVVEPKVAFEPDPNRTEYQLIFNQIPETEKIKRYLKQNERLENYLTSFGHELTRVSAEGYRLVSIAFSPRFAVLRREDHQYEYEVVLILSRSDWFPIHPKFDLTYDQWARKGFRVADYVVLNDFCENRMDDMSLWGTTLDCHYFGVLVLERRLNSLMPDHNYRIVKVRPTFSKETIQTGLEDELDSAHQSRLYPTHMITKFQLLTQSAFGTEDNLRGEYETEIVTGDLKKRINLLAQQGYRLFVRPHLFEAAVMHRMKGATSPTSYVWIGGNKLEQELPRLQEQGASYRMNYGCWEGRVGGTQMIFEQPSVIDDTLRQYRVLPIEVKETTNGTFELISGSRNAINELSRLTKEGFEVRDFFNCTLSNKKKRPSGVKILLERVVTKEASN